MGRAPCCDKANVKKGPWSPEEDAKLKSYIEQQGTGGNWIALPQKIGLKRCGKSCRLRWLNYLRPNIKHGGFSEEEDNIICNLYISIGSRWSIIAAQLPGRTDNDIKNYWNTRLKKKLLGKQRKEQQARRVSCLKQELRKSDNSMAPAACSQNPYWPELPVLPAAPIPYSNQEPRLNDHTSIRKLLIKLGGKFSDDMNQQVHDGSTNLDQFPIDISPSNHQIYQHSSSMISTAPLDGLNNLNPTYQFTNTTQYTMEGPGLDMFQGQNTSLNPDQLEQMGYSNPQRLDGLEFLYGDEMDNNGTGSCGGSWGEMSSVALYPLAASNYDKDIQPGMMLQECAFDHEMRYPTV